MHPSLRAGCAIVFFGVLHNPGDVGMPKIKTNRAAAKRFTKTGSSLLVMAIAGGAVLPLLYEQVSSWSDPKQAYLMVVPCYLIIGLYAIWGHKLRLKKTS